MEIEIVKDARYGTIICALNQKISISSSSSLAAAVVAVAAVAAATLWVKMKMETETLQNCNEQRIKQLKCANNVIQMELHYVFLTKIDQTSNQLICNKEVIRYRFIEGFSRQVMFGETTFLQNNA